MDLRGVGFSTVAVFGVLTVSGTLISLLSSYLQCSKGGITTSVTQGFISATLPSIVYGLAVAFPVVRNPFKLTLERFGISSTVSDVVAVGYLVMLMSWITAVWNIHNTQKAVCQPSTQEMTEFKKKLLAELEEKERQREKNATK